MLRSVNVWQRVLPYAFMVSMISSSVYGMLARDQVHEKAWPLYDLIVERLASCDELKHKTFCQQVGAAADEATVLLSELSALLEKDTQWRGHEAYDKLRQLYRLEWNEQSAKAVFLSQVRDRLLAVDKALSQEREPLKGKVRRLVAALIKVFAKPSKMRGSFLGRHWRKIATIATAVVVVGVALRALYTQGVQPLKDERARLEQAAQSAVERSRALVDNIPAAVVYRRLKRINERERPLMRWLETPKNGSSGAEALTLSSVIDKKSTFWGISPETLPFVADWCRCHTETIVDLYPDLLLFNADDQSELYDDGLSCLNQIHRRELHRADKKRWKTGKIYESLMKEVWDTSDKTLVDDFLGDYPFTVQDEEYIAAFKRGEKEGRVSFPQDKQDERIRLYTALFRHLSEHDGWSTSGQYLGALDLGDKRRASHGASALAQERVRRFTHMMRHLKRRIDAAYKEKVMHRNRVEAGDESDHRQEDARLVREHITAPTDKPSELDRLGEPEAGVVYPVLPSTMRAALAMGAKRVWRAMRRLPIHDKDERARIKANNEKLERFAYDLKQFAATVVQEGQLWEQAKVLARTADGRVIPDGLMPMDRRREIGNADGSITIADFRKHLVEPFLATAEKRLRPDAMGRVLARMHPAYVWRDIEIKEGVEIPDGDRGEHLSTPCTQEESDRFYEEWLKVYRRPKWVTPSRPKYYQANWGRHAQEEIFFDKKKRCEGGWTEWSWNNFYRSAREAGCAEDLIEKLQTIPVLQWEAELARDKARAEGRPVSRNFINEWYRDWLMKEKEELGEKWDKLGRHDQERVDEREIVRLRRERRAAGEEVPYDEYYDDSYDSDGEEDLSTLPTVGELRLDYAEDNGVPTSIIEYARITPVAQWRDDFHANYGGEEESKGDE